MGEDNLGPDENMKLSAKELLHARFSELVVSRVLQDCHAGKTFQALDQVLDQINKDHMKMFLCIQFDMSAGLTQYSRINYNAHTRKEAGPEAV